MFKDFKAFVMRGNVLDLAVAVILGASFGAIVTSVVNDIVMPPIGLILGHIDFKELFISLNGQAYPTLAAAKAAAAPVIAYGQSAKLQRKPEAAPAAPTTKDCGFCCTSIPIAATRCPNCTSQLLSPEAAAQ